MNSEGKDCSWGAVVYDHPDEPMSERRFLLVKMASGNHWDHPKGHAEGHESPQETARREIREEGGVEVRFIGDFQVTAEWIMPSGRPKEACYFLAEKSEDAFLCGPEGEILDHVWLTYTEARERITYETGRRVLDEAFKYLGG